MAIKKYQMKHLLCIALITPVIIMQVYKSECGRKSYNLFNKCVDNNMNI